MDANTEAKLERMTESALYKIAVPAVMSLAISVLAWSVNKLADHFDRIDSHLVATDLDTSALKRDVADLKQMVPQRTQQIQEIRDMALQTRWDVSELQRLMPGRH